MLIDRLSEYDQQCSNDSLALVFSSRPIKMSPRFVLGRENVPYVAEVVNRSLKADCTDFTIIFFKTHQAQIQTFSHSVIFSDFISDYFQQQNCVLEWELVHP